MRTGQLSCGFGIAVAALNIMIAGGCDGGGSGATGSGTANVSETRGDGGKLTAEDRAAAEFVQAKVDAHWVKAADGWTTQLQRRNMFGEPMEGLPEILFEQYRDLKFSVRPMEVSESQRLNGATYRAEVSFASVPMRQYRAIESLGNPIGWLPWQEYSPASSFAVELRNGKWLMEDMEMFAGLKPDPSAIPASK